MILILSLSVMLATVCFVDDLILTLSASHAWRAAADSAIHGVIGLLSWAVVMSPGLNFGSSLSCVLCGLAACAIDTDHFIVSKSLKLQDALNLKERPFFHSTTLLLIVTMVMWMMALLLKSVQLKMLTLIYITAGITHHLRDATRRGLWFPPLGNSPPVSKVVYVCGTVSLALCMHAFYAFCVKKPVKENFPVIKADSV